LSQEDSGRKCHHPIVVRASRAFTLDVVPDVLEDRHRGDERVFVVFAERHRCLKLRNFL
jgi:hypothetical protein